MRVLATWIALSSDELDLLSVLFMARCFLVAALRSETYLSGLSRLRWLPELQRLACQSEQPRSGPERCWNRRFGLHRI